MEKQRRKKNGVQRFILRSRDQNGGWSSSKYLRAKISILMASGGALLFSIYHRVVGDSYNKYCTENVIINLE